MRTGSLHKVIFPLVALILGGLAVAFFIGLPFGDSSKFSDAEMQQADDVAADLAKFMGDVTISPENCDEILSKLPFYIDKITPLTEKLVSMDTSALDEIDFNKISDLSEGIQWIYSKCQK